MFLGFLSEAVGRVLGHPYSLNYTQVEQIIHREKKLSIEIAFNGAAFRQRVGEMGLSEVLTVA